MLRTVRYGLYSAVLAALVAATIAWIGTDKTVTLVVDGHSTTVRTTAGDVRGVLADAGFHYGPHDRLLPGAQAGVHDGSRVVLDRGRLLHLDVDGEHISAWTTARTVAAAMTQLGYPPTAFVAVSRSGPLPLHPTDITVRTPDWTAATAAPDDSPVQVAADAAGPIPTRYAVAITGTPALAAAPAGLRAASHAASHTTSHKTSASKNERRAERSAVADPTPSAAALSASAAASAASASGTPTATPNPGPSASASGSSGSSPSAAGSTGAKAESPRQIGQELVAAHGWGSQQFACLNSLWNHESHWNVHAHNSSSGAYGIPQALPGSKMSSAGPDWQNNARTQITWGLGYIAGRYNTPCGAWSFWQSSGWY